MGTSKGFDFFGSMILDLGKVTKEVQYVPGPPRGGAANFITTRAGEVAAYSGGDVGTGTSSLISSDSLVPSHGVEQAEVGVARELTSTLSLES